MLASDLSGVSEQEEKGEITQKEAYQAKGGAIGGAGGALAGAAGGAALGTLLLPGVGTVIGGIAGGILGSMAGEAGGAAIGIYALLTGLLDKGDDVISPGYGKRMIFSPEGAVALNNNDTIVAGTNLGGGSNQSANTSSPSINLSPLVERMSAVEKSIITNPI